jgi:hypothetical protein
MTTVRNGHVRGLTPAMTETDRSFGRPAGAKRGEVRPPVRNGHVRGLTPGMAQRDGIG